MVTRKPPISDPSENAAEIKALLAEVQAVIRDDAAELIKAVVGEVRAILLEIFDDTRSRMSRLEARVARLEATELSAKRLAIIREAREGLKLLGGTENLTEVPRRRVDPERDVLGGFGEDPEALRSDSQAWAEEQAELATWDSSLGDRLDRDDDC